MNRYILSLLLCFVAIVGYPQDTLLVNQPSGDMTHRLQSAILRTRTYGGQPIVIRLASGNYLLSCDNVSHTVYHVSNTTSEDEQPNPNKHVGLWLKGLKNTTFDGAGNCLCTWEPIISIVAYDCENILSKFQDGCNRFHRDRVKCSRHTSSRHWPGAPATLHVRYIHPQSYGCSPLLSGDSAELVDAQNRR